MYVLMLFLLSLAGKRASVSATWAETDRVRTPGSRCCQTGTWVRPLLEPPVPTCSSGLTSALPRTVSALPLSNLSSGRTQASKLLTPFAGPIVLSKLEESLGNWAYPPKSCSLLSCERTQASGFPIPCLPPPTHPTCFSELGENPGVWAPSIPLPCCPGWRREPRHPGS